MSFNSSATDSRARVVSCSSFSRIAVSSVSTFLALASSCAGLGNSPCNFTTAGGGLRLACFVFSGASTSRSAFHLELYSARNPSAICSRIASVGANVCPHLGHLMFCSDMGRLWVVGADLRPARFIHNCITTSLPEEFLVRPMLPVNKPIQWIIDDVFANLFQFPLMANDALDIRVAKRVGGLRSRIRYLMRRAENDLNARTISNSDGLFSAAGAGLMPALSPAANSPVGYLRLAITARTYARMHMIRHDDELVQLYG